MQYYRTPLPLLPLPVVVEVVLGGETTSLLNQLPVREQPVAMCARVSIADDDDEGGKAVVVAVGG